MTDVVDDDDGFFQHTPVPNVECRISLAVLIV